MSRISDLAGGITQLSNRELEREIDRYWTMYKAASPKLVTTRTSINKKLQSLINEQQNRLLDQWIDQPDE